jgi:hypothetical protein
VVPKQGVRIANVTLKSSVTPESHINNIYHVVFRCCFCVYGVSDLTNWADKAGSDVVMLGNSADVEEAPQGHLVTEPRRINVAISPDTVRALESVIEREGVTLTEALRRLIGYGDFVYRAVRQQGDHLFLNDANGTREVVLL